MSDRDHISTTDRDHITRLAEVWRRVLEEQKELDRIIRALIHSAEELSNSDPLTRRLPKPGNTSEVGHLPGLG